MSCGKWCVYYKDRGKTSACFGCRYFVLDNTPRFELGKVDIFELAIGLAEKEKKAKEQDKVADDAPKDKPKVILGICPYCGERSWWLNPYTNKYECMNKKSCPTHSLSASLSDHLKHSFQRKRLDDYQSESSCVSQFSNPMLLSVKMFLADVIYIINGKYEEGHVCADFAQEVCDVATERGIRCGYTVISFKGSNIAHAIVAFQTDYGLKFFEPQNGNEEEIKVGQCYSVQLEGVPIDNIITKIEITWNDGTLTTID